MSLDDVNLNANESSKRAILFEAPDSLINALDAKRRVEGKTRARTLRQLVETYVGNAATERREQQVNESIDDGQKRSVFFRLSPREVALAQTAAENFGGITAWAAGLVRSRIGTRSALVAETERAALVESTAQLRRIGINLNQIAYRLNRDERHEMTAIEREEIQEACRQVKIYSSAVDRLIQEVRARGEGGDGKG